MFKKLSFIILLPIYLFLSGCGERTDLSTFPITNNGNPVVSDTSYVQLYPVWTQFNQPEDILLGNEPLIYVADTKNNSVVQLDLSGVIIGSKNLGSNIFPKKIAQDLNFDLLVLCDSVATPDTVSVLYRLRLVPAGGIVTNAQVISLMNSAYPTPNTSLLRKFTGISTYPDNTYLITRIGPADPIGIDPGNAILHVKGKNSIENVTVLSGLQASGNSFYSIENVSAVKIVKNSTTDFIIARNTNDSSSLNKVIWFVYNTTNGTYDPKFTSSSIDIVSARFGRPYNIVQDNNYSVYVIDALKNYLYKYNSSGKLMHESFGKYGSGEKEFNSPKGISFFNKVLYIADTGNNRILRFKLSTDIN